jgi:hypothetical protein
MAKWKVGRIYDYEAILRYIVFYKIDHNGNSPSTRDIMEDFGIPSTSIVARIIDTLALAGKLKRVGRCRQLEVPGIKVIYEAEPCPTESFDVEASIA